MKKSKFIIIVIILMLVLSSCATDNKVKTENLDTLPAVENVFEEKEVKVTIDEAKKIIEEDNDLIILDTRTQEEYDDGHIENAILIPYDQLEMNLEELKGYEDKPILVYCRTGNRSTMAVETLIKNGFNKIYHMNQGYSKWK